MTKEMDEIKKQLARHDKAIGIMKNDLKHGASAFEEIKGTLKDMSDDMSELSSALIKHMNAEQKELGKLYKMMALYLLGITIALIVYIWESHTIS